jgi:hypothetical protein
VLGPPTLWGWLTREWIVLPPALAWVLWRAVCKAQWSWAAEWSEARGNGEAAIERLHGLIPSEVVPHHQKVTAVEAGQQCKVINDALFGV